MKKNRNLKAPAPTQPTVAKRTDGYYAQIAPKTISRTRQDIAAMQRAWRQRDNVLMPKQVLLQKLYKDIMLDALLSSQIGNRRMISTSAPFSLKKGDTIDEASTDLLKSLPWFSDLIGHIWDTQMSGTALVEMVTDKNGVLKPVLIPKTNIIPEKGILLLDETSFDGVLYREAKEYGSWLMEFGQPDDWGLLMKAVPHVLMKRFAQSCWSELCEIYGIPPRVMKTNTQDSAMLDRAESMMRDMGAAAWFIIDDSEEFEFATGAVTTGDVYNNLIKLCNNENSILIVGAIIGQDTKNGNESKEKVSVQQLMRLAESDKRLVEGYMNTVVLSALYKIGLLPEGLIFAYDPQENTEDLYTMTVGFMQYLEPDIDWINEKFGTKFLGVKQASLPPAGGTGGNFQPDPKKK
jgi:hypothetical protein